MRKRIGLGLPGASELAAGLEPGKLDVAFIGSVPAITFQATGHDLAIFGGAMTKRRGYVIKAEPVPPDFQEGDIGVFGGKNIASRTEACYCNEKPNSRISPAAAGSRPAPSSCAPWRKRLNLTWMSNLSSRGKTGNFTVSCRPLSQAGDGSLRG
jgi:hypothetical protein